MGFKEITKCVSVGIMEVGVGAYMCIVPSKIFLHTIVDAQYITNCH